jgi:hypothetical protein
MIGNQNWNGTHGMLLFPLGNSCHLSLAGDGKFDIYSLSIYGILTRSYYSDDITNFLKKEADLILSKLTRNHAFALEEQQRYAWLKEIDISKKELKYFTSGYMIFEYFIPKMGWFLLWNFLSTL